MKLLNELLRYLKHFNTKFIYGVIGFYIAVLYGITVVYQEDGFWWALVVYLIVEGIYGSIVIITYLMEKYVTKTYK
jgi:hypothetical protein